MPPTRPQREDPGVHTGRPLLPRGLSEGKLMTRQARRLAAAAEMRTKLNQFPVYVDKMRTIVRRVKQRIAAQRAATKSRNSSRPVLWYVRRSQLL